MEEQMKARIAELEAERDAAVALQQGVGEVQDSLLDEIKSLRAERDALKVDAERIRKALMLAREGYVGERATGLPVLREWRERTIQTIDAAMKPKESGQ